MTELFPSDLQLITLTRSQYEEDIREAKELALREAAEDCRAELGNEVHGHTSTYSVRRWLHERANKMVGK